MESRQINKYYQKIPEKYIFLQKRIAIFLNFFMLKLIEAYSLKHTVIDKLFGLNLTLHQINKITRVSPL
jgi:hypothetical protein